MLYANNHKNTTNVIVKWKTKRFTDQKDRITGFTSMSVLASGSSSKRSESAPPVDNEEYSSTVSSSVQEQIHSERKFVNRSRIFPAEKRLRNS
jgi:hypothetical protein